MSRAERTGRGGKSPDVISGKGAARRPIGLYWPQTQTLPDLAARARSKPRVLLTLPAAEL